jgi:hypothetical protein
MFLNQNQVFTGDGVRTVGKILGQSVKTYDGNLWYGRTIFTRGNIILDNHVEILLPGDRRLKLAPEAKVLLQNCSTKKAKDLKGGDELFFVPLANGFGVDCQHCFKVVENNLIFDLPTFSYEVTSFAKFVTMDTGIMISTN